MTFDPPIAQLRRALFQQDPRERTAPTGGYEAAPATTHSGRSERILQRAEQIGRHLDHRQRPMLMERRAEHAEAQARYEQEHLDALGPGPPAPQPFRDTHPVRPEGMSYADFNQSEPYQRYIAASQANRDSAFHHRAHQNLLAHARDRRDSGLAAAQDIRARAGEIRETEPEFYPENMDAYLFAAHQMEDVAPVRLKGTEGFSERFFGDRARFHATPIPGMRNVIAANDFMGVMAEIPHAQQLSEMGHFRMALRRLMDWRHGDKGRYDTPGTLEHDAHLIREEELWRQLENPPRPIPQSQ